MGRANPKGEDANLWRLKLSRNLIYSSDDLSFILRATSPKWLDTDIFFLVVPLAIAIHEDTNEQK